MSTPPETPLVRLGNLFPEREVYAKCEFLAPSGCFKIRGARHLLERLRAEGPPRKLVVPSMGNTALGAAEAARAFGFPMVGVVPESIAPAKDEKLRALGVELVKVAGGGSDLLATATRLADETGGYFVHPHLDPAWTDGYQSLADEVLRALPACRTLVIPVGGGGLLLGMLASPLRRQAGTRIVGCEPYNYPKYASFTHARSSTLADGLRLEIPHPAVQEQIARETVEIVMISEEAIRDALRDLYRLQGLAVEPSSVLPVSLARQRPADLEAPVVVVLTGENIARADYLGLVAG